MTPLLNATQRLLRTCGALNANLSANAFSSEWSSGAPLTSQEVATALRPFFFVVHPDRFGQFPSERTVNENSLKLLNSYLESRIERRRTDTTRVTFFVRHESADKSRPNSSSEAIGKSGGDRGDQLKQIHISLSDRESLNSAVHRILSESRLSTDYLVRIGKQPKTQTESKGSVNETIKFNSKKFSGYRGTMEAFWMRDQMRDTDFRETESVIRRKTELNFVEWMKKNADKANCRLKATKPIREELNRLSEELRRELSLETLIWDCGWGVSHIRGCLKSLNTLKQQHSHDLNSLSGKTLVFGRQTGVSFDGHVILNIEDVRHNWLELIRKIHVYDSFLEKLPFAEAVLSGALRGIQIDHRKFRPAVMITHYIQQLEKLTTAIGAHFADRGHPKLWPSDLSNYQLVVECEAGPLMLSPTGQFIVPASCPAFLLVDFISENLPKAKRLIELYSSHKLEEVAAINQCLTELGIDSLEKDDNVTPDLMIACCQNLLKNRNIVSRFVRDSRLRVSHYYSVLLDGEICIPWNFQL